MILLKLTVNSGAPEG